MPSTQTDRLFGENSAVAVKAPVAAVASGNNALSGLGAFTMPNGGSYTPAEGDRILCIGQTDATTNGIYNASQTGWQRSGDFDGFYDVAEGTLVVALQGSTGIFYQLTTVDPVIGTTALNFTPVWQPANVLYPRTSAEITAGVVPTNLTYEPGDVRRYGFNGDSGVTDNTVALNNALLANAGFRPVRVPNMGGYAKVAGILTCPANTQLFIEDEAELRWSAAGATSVGWSTGGSAPTAGIQVTGDHVEIRGGLLTGPSGAGVYTANEFGIFRVGAGSGNQGTGSPGTHLKIDGVELKFWGAYGIGVRFVDHVEVLNKTHVHDCGYQGINLSSCKFGLIDSAIVHDITPGTVGNAYGTSFSHDTVGYSTDPEVVAGAPRLAVNPYCSGCTIRNSTVYNVPLWEGIDMHGGFDCQVIGCRVYNCSVGIWVSHDSSTAFGLTGEGNAVIDCRVDGRQIDGSATTVANGGAAGTGTQVGISMSGLSTTQYQKNCTVRGNTISQCGDRNAGVTSNAILVNWASNADVSGNKIDICYGKGICGQYFSGVIRGNVFGPVGTNANSTAIYLNGNNGSTVIGDNRHDALGGSVYAVGADLSTTNAARCVLSGNDFSQANTPYGSNWAFLTKGQSDLAPIISVTTGAGGSQTVDLSPVGDAPVVYVRLAPTANFTLTGFLGSRFGQTVLLSMHTAFTVTVNDTGLTGGINLQGGTAAVTNKSTMAFLCVGNNGNPLYYELSRALGNS